MNEPKPMSTAPKDGRVFLAADQFGLWVPVWIIHEERRTRTVKSWWGRTREVVDEEGGSFLCYAMPYGSKGAASRMNIRPDFGWYPTHWMELPEPPALSPLHGDRK